MLSAHCLTLRCMLVTSYRHAHRRMDAFASCVHPMANHAGRARAGVPTTLTRARPSIWTGTIPEWACQALTSPLLTTPPCIRRFRRVHVRAWPPATTTASAGAAALGPGPRARGPATMSSLRPTDVTVRAQCGFNHSRKNHPGTRCTGVREGRLRVASSLAQRVSGRCPTHLR